MRKLKPKEALPKYRSNWVVFHLDLADAGARKLTHSSPQVESPGITVAPIEPAITVTIAGARALPDFG